MAEWPWKTKFDLLKNKQLGSNYSQLWSQCWWRAFSKLLISCQESRFELAVLELVLIQRVLLIHLDDCLDQNQLLLFQLIWSFLTSSIRWLLHNLPQVMRSLVSWNPQNWPSSSQQGSSIAIPAFSYHQQPSSNTDTHTSLYLVVIEHTLTPQKLYQSWQSVFQVHTFTRLWNWVVADILICESWQDASNDDNGHNEIDDKTVW